MLVQFIQKYDTDYKRYSAVRYFHSCLTFRPQLSLSVSNKWAEGESYKE